MRSRKLHDGRASPLRRLRVQPLPLARSSWQEAPSRSPSTASHGAESGRQRPDRQTTILFAMTAASSAEVQEKPKGPAPETAEEGVEQHDETEIAPREL